VRPVRRAQGLHGVGQVVAVELAQYGAVRSGDRRDAGRLGQLQVEPLVAAVELRPARCTVHLLDQVLQPGEVGGGGVPGGEVGDAAFQGEAVVDQAVDRFGVRAAVVGGHDGAAGMSFTDG